VAALTAVNSGIASFITDTVYGSSRTVFNFNGRASPASSQAGLTFDDSSNLVRLLRIRQSDDGLYSLNGDIDLYPTDSGATGMIANAYADLIYTDDGTRVDVCLNGVLQFSDADS
jgi:hypothetical protein